MTALLEQWAVKNPEAALRWAASLPGLLCLSRKSPTFSGRWSTQFQRQDVAY